MTSEDSDSLSEDDIDAIVDRVVDRLDAANAAGEGPDETDADAAAGETDDDAVPVETADGDERRQERDRRERAAEELREEAERHRSERRSAAPDDFGDRIERAVESRLESVADTLERSLEPSAAPEPPDPPQGIVVGPGDSREKAVYKTQLQKGGRVAVPDAEIEALGLDPGDTLQVVLYPVK